MYITQTLTTHTLWRPTSQQKTHTSTSEKSTKSGGEQKHATTGGSGTLNDSTKEGEKREKQPHHHDHQHHRHYHDRHSRRSRQGQHEGVGVSEVLRLRTTLEAATLYLSQTTVELGAMGIAVDLLRTTHSLRSLGMGQSFHSTLHPSTTHHFSESIHASTRLRPLSPDQEGVLGADRDDLGAHRRRYSSYISEERERLLLPTPTPPSAPSSTTPHHRRSSSSPGEYTIPPPANLLASTLIRSRTDTDVVTTTTITEDVHMVPTRTKPPLPHFPPPPHVEGPHLALARSATGGLGGMGLPLFGHKNSRGSVSNAEGGGGVKAGTRSGLSTSHRPFSTSIPVGSNEQPQPQSQLSTQPPQPHPQPQLQPSQASQHPSPPSPSSHRYGDLGGSGKGSGSLSVNKRMSRSASTGELYSAHAGPGLAPGLGQGQGLGQGSGQGFGKMFASMFTPHHQTTKPDLHSLPPPHTTCETSRILYIPELICAICHSVYDPSTAYGHHDVYLYPAKEVCTPTTRKYTHHTSWRKTIAVK